jgi:hypothetical protein
MDNSIFWNGLIMTGITKLNVILQTIKTGLLHEQAVARGYTFPNYSDHPKTGLIRYSNCLFQVVPGIWLPEHLKTKQICPVLEWSTKLDCFMHLEIISFMYKMVQSSGIKILSGFRMAKTRWPTIRKPDTNCKLCPKKDQSKTQPSGIGMVTVYHTLSYLK